MENGVLGFFEREEKVLENGELIFLRREEKVLENGELRFLEVGEKVLVNGGLIFLKSEDKVLENGGLRFFRNMERLLEIGFWRVLGFWEKMFESWGLVFMIGELVLEIFLERVFVFSVVVFFWNGGEIVFGFFGLVFKNGMLEFGIERKVFEIGGVLRVLGVGRLDFGSGG